jgi:D-cysteine desulfhydrase
VAEPRPPRLALARTPTPLERSPRLGAQLGTTLLWKRDDLTGVELSGNKIRKLEVLLADAEAQGADTLITCGAEQSNHCRATAFAAAKRGLGCVLLLRVADPSAPPALAANSLLDRIAGAQVRYVSVADYQRRDQIFASVSEELRRAGKHPYVIPEGASNALGAWGYVAAVEELRAQLAALAPESAGRPVTVAYACGSGGTGAGIELGLRLTGWREARAIGFAVCDNRAHFQTTIAGLVEEASRRWSLGVSLAPDQIAIEDRFTGAGLARPAPGVLAAIRQVGAADGLILDPVYTGKAFFGLTQVLEADPALRRSTVVLIQTGGSFGVFPYAAELFPAGA